MEPEKNKETDMFQFMRLNLIKLQGTLVFDAIFTAFWDEQQRLIVKYFFVPFFVYFVFSNFYFTQCLLADLGPKIGLWHAICPLFYDEGEECTIIAQFEFYIRIYLFCHILILQATIEILQIRSDGFRSYIAQTSNKIDVISIVLNTLTLTLVSVDFDIQKTRIVAACANGTLWMILFFWFRLFDSLAQYVDLIFQTVYDIKYFMCVLISILLMAVAGFQVIQTNRIEVEPMFDYDPEKGSLFNMSLLAQYRWFLGEWGEINMIRSYEGYDGNTSNWIFFENLVVVFYFFFSSFITQIVILNMLVAIMSATFARHENSLQENAKRQKLVLQSEFVRQIKFYRKYVQFCFNVQKNVVKEPADQLFVVTRSKNKDNDSDNELKSGEGHGKYKGGAGAGGDVNILIQQKFKELDTFLIKKMMKTIGDFSTETRMRLEAIEHLNKESQDQF